MIINKIIIECYYYYSRLANPPPTLPLIQHFNIGEGEGWVDSFPEFYTDPNVLTDSIEQIRRRSIWVCLSMK